MNRKTASVSAGIDAFGSIGKKEEGDAPPEKKTERRILSEQAISGHHRCGDSLKVALSCKSGYNISREQENGVSPGRCLVGTFSMPVASATTIGRGSVLTAGSSCGRTLGGVTMEGALIGSFSFALFYQKKTPVAMPMSDAGGKISFFLLFCYMIIFLCVRKPLPTKS